MSRSSSYHASSPTADHLLVLQEYFGHGSFRPMQWRIICAALEVGNHNYLYLLFQMLVVSVSLMSVECTDTRKKADTHIF